MKTARIFEECTGLYHYCDEDLDYLDARGNGYPTRAAAMRAAFSGGYDRAVGSGAYRDGSIKGQIRLTTDEILEHDRYKNYIETLRYEYC